MIGALIGWGVGGVSPAALDSSNTPIVSRHPDREGGRGGSERAGVLSEDNLPQSVETPVTSRGMQAARMGKRRSRRGAGSHVGGD